MNNRIIYDYLTFTTQIHTKEQIVGLLGLHDIKFEQGNGFHGYHYQLFFEKLRIHYGGREGMGVCVEMSGDGCRAWEEYGTGDYDGIFKLILENYDDRADERTMNITRLDIAYDDFNGLLDLRKLMRYTRKRHFISKFKQWSVTEGSEGGSITHGSMRSNTFVRIYDKKMEQRSKGKEYENVDHWVRCEFQLRKECALGFIKLDDTIDKKYFDVLNNYLRYIVPDKSQTNVSRLETAPYWQKWLESFGKVSIFAKPASDYNLGKLYGFSVQQAGGAIRTAVNIWGVDKFMQMIHDDGKGKPKNPKYKQLESTHEKSNTDLILEFLRERGLTKT